MVVNGFVSVVISTIERRFELSSKQSGFVASGYDIASVLCLIPVSYIGGRGHKPRWIAAGVLLLSIGSFMFALPHFVADFYRYDEVGEVLGPLAMCRSSAAHVPPLNASSSSSVSCEDSIALTKTSRLSVFMFVMAVAQMLHGAGATPIYTLAVTYLDDILKPKVTPLYLGTCLVQTSRVGSNLLSEFIIVFIIIIVFQMPQLAVYSLLWLLGPSVMACLHALLWVQCLLVSVKNCVKYGSRRALEH